ncbi:hypothetical protein J2741_002274 [Methanolinea mesophila]|uniref:hypothetical protein n=1 Tax=Methanolinea mesophila TaxID=547055 RepID=UPI001AE7576F|nr:hypothetical protein [Methanolinea mesophila]MBP1929727.1 hypothetical protein [Methanolinea mesophila]
MNHTIPRITAALVGACLLCLLVASASAGFSGTMLGPGPSGSQQFSIAALTGGNQWSSASLISSAAAGNFGSQTHFILTNWTPPENRTYTTPTRETPAFMQPATSSRYNWDTIFAKPTPFCGCGGCS